MGSIPLPALSVRPPQQPADPLESYGRVVQLKNLLAQQQLLPIQKQAAETQLQGAQQENQIRAQQIQDTQNSLAILGKHNGDLNAALPELAKAVSPRTYLSLRQAGLDIQKTLSEIGDNELKTKQYQNSQLLGLVNQAKQLPPDQYAAQFPQIAQQAMQINPSLKLDPTKPIPQEQLGGLSVGLMTQEQFMAQEKEKREAQGQQTQQAETARHNTVEEKQGAQRLGLEGAKLKEQVRHDQATEGVLTPDALDLAARQFATTGQMPQLGRSAGIRAQIINRAAQVYPNLDPAANAAEYGANKKSLENAQKNFDQVTAFENTAGKNLDTFLQTAQKIVDSGSPLINSPVRKLSDKAIGSENMAAFNAARTTALTEISKVLSSANAGNGVVSDSARGEVEGLIGPNATLKQIYSAAKILRQDMQNRHDAYQDQISAIKSRIGGGKQQSQPTQPAAGGKEIHYKIVNGQLVAQ